MIDMSLTFEACAAFLLWSLGVAVGVFLLCLAFGWLTALARYWRVEGPFEILCKWLLNPCLAVLRRIPPVGMLLFSAVLRFFRQSWISSPFLSDLMPWLVFFLLAACFVPDVSDALLENLRRVTGDDGSDAYILRIVSADGGGFPRFLRYSRSHMRQALAASVPVLVETLGEVWKVSYVYFYLYGAGRSWYSQVYASQYIMKNCIILCIIYWLTGLAMDGLLGLFGRRLPAGEQSK